MKVAILTFHNALNYGAVLQTYALQKKLIEYNSETEVLDYTCEALRKFYSPFHIEKFSIRKIVYAIVNFAFVVKKRSVFNNFLKNHCRLSSIRYSKNNISDANEYYDNFIVGSDQIWNYRCTDFDKTYLLDFSSKAKNSYAASFGCSELDDNYKSEYKILLERFDNISVREKQGIRIIENITKKNVVQMPDPVFLLSDDEWRKLAAPIPHKKGYILVYKLISEQVYDYAEALSRKTAKPVVEIQAPLKQFRQFEKHRIVTVEEFLGWILNADYIVTDSFHAVSFSIIFNKTVKVVLNSNPHNANSRLTDLLNTLHLEEFLVLENDKNVNQVKKDVYKYANCEIIRQRLEAEKYLQSLVKE